MKLAAALLAFFAFAVPTTALAQDEPSACSEGYALVISVGGPLCVAPIYLEDRWDDPTLCEHGYYQGSCAPAPTVPVVFAPEAYAFQPIPTRTPTPVAAIVRVVVDDTLCLIQRPC